MWYGKISIIIYVFCFGLLFMQYFIGSVFNDPFITNSATYQSLATLMGNYKSTPELNTNLIFGDFIAAYNLLGGLLSGGLLGNSPVQTEFGTPGTGGTSVTGGIMAGAGIVGYNSIQLLMGLLFDSATLFFVIYIISNRSI